MGSKCTYLVNPDVFRSRRIHRVMIKEYPGYRKEHMEMFRVLPERERAD